VDGSHVALAGGGGRYTVITAQLSTAIQPHQVGFACFQQQVSMAGTPDDNDPFPLAEACKIFPHAKLTPSTLRAEANRGRLAVFRLGKRDYTTIAAMRDMVRRCQESACRPASTSIPPGANGLSETEQLSSAQDALSQTLKALKGDSVNTSRASISQNQARRH
jgi:hypothetical protein